MKAGEFFPSLFPNMGNNSAVGGCFISYRRGENEGIYGFLSLFSYPTSETDVLASFPKSILIQMRREEDKK